MHLINYRCFRFKCKHGKVWRKKAQYREAENSTPLRDGGKRVIPRKGNRADQKVHDDAGQFAREFNTPRAEPSML